MTIRSAALFGRIAGLGLIGLIAFFQPARAETQQTCTNFTINNLTASPLVLNDGDAANMLGTLRERSGAICDAAIPPDGNQGGIPTVGFQKKQLTTPDPDNQGQFITFDAKCSDVGGQPSWPYVNKNHFDPPMSANPLLVDGNGQVAGNFDTSGRAGQIIGFRANHDNEGSSSGGNTQYQGSTSPCIDLQVSASGTLSPCDSFPGAGVVPVVSHASGDGTPPVGSNGPWTFRITIYACNSVLLQSAQGGSSGWTEVSPSGVSTSPAANPPGCTNKKTQGRSSTEVLFCLWGNQSGKKYTGGLQLNAGDTVTIDVTETGSIPSTAPNGQVRCLNGPWSAIYSADGGDTFIKSPYTNRAAVTVTNPDDSANNPGVLGCT